MLWLALLASVAGAQDVRTFGFTDVDLFPLKVDAEVAFKDSQLADCPANPFAASNARYLLASSVLAASSRANGSSTQLRDACDHLSSLYMSKLGDWPDLCATATGPFSCQTNTPLLQAMSDYMHTNDMSGRVWISVSRSDPASDPGLIWYPVILAMHTYQTPSLLDWDENCDGTTASGTAAILSVTAQGSSDFWDWLAAPLDHDITEDDIPTILGVTYRQADGAVRSWPNQAPSVVSGGTPRRSTCGWTFSDVTGLIDPASEAEADAVFEVIERPHVGGGWRPVFEK